MKRRHFIGLAGFTGLAGAIPGISFGFPRLDLEAAPDIEPLELSEDEWRERLSDEAYDVLRDHGTEPAFSSPLDKEWGEGEYRCAGCDLLLFTSEMKFDSGTGWPSFLSMWKDTYSPSSILSWYGRALNTTAPVVVAIKATCLKMAPSQPGFAGVIMVWR